MVAKSVPRRIARAVAEPNDVVPTEDDDASIRRMTSTQITNKRAGRTESTVASASAVSSEPGQEEAEEFPIRAVPNYLKTSDNRPATSLDTCYALGGRGSDVKLRGVNDLPSRDYVVCPPWSPRSFVDPSTPVGSTTIRVNEPRQSSSAPPPPPPPLQRRPSTAPLLPHPDLSRVDRTSAVLLERPAFEQQKYYLDNLGVVVLPADLTVDRRRPVSVGVGDYFVEKPDHLTLDSPRRMVVHSGGSREVPRTGTASQDSGDVLRGSRYQLDPPVYQGGSAGGKKARISAPAAATMTKGNGEGGGSEEASPSVLRALLQQASGKQAAVYNHAMPEVITPPPSRPAVIRPNPGSQPLPSAAGGQRVRRKSAGVPMDVLDEIVPHRRSEQQRREESCRSEIKALLMGERYQRLPTPPTLRVNSPTDAVDLSRRGSRGGRSAECGVDRGGRRPTPASKRVRLDDTLSAVETHVIYQEHSLSPFLVQVVDLVNEFDDLSYSIQRGNLFSSVEVRRKGLYGVPVLGLTPAQVVVEETGHAHLLTAVATATSATTTVFCRDSRDRLSEAALRPLLLKLSVCGGHVFCPGVLPEMVELANPTSSAAKSVIRVEMGPGQLFPLRFQARDCPVWFKLQGQGWLPLNEGVHRCNSCKTLERRLKAARRSKSVGGWTADGRPRVTSAPS